MAGKPPTRVGAGDEGNDGVGIVARCRPSAVADAPLRRTNALSSSFVPGPP